MFQIPVSNLKMPREDVEILALLGAFLFLLLRGGILNLVNYERPVCKCEGVLLSRCNLFECNTNCRGLSKGLYCIVSYDGGAAIREFVDRSAGCNNSSATKKKKEYIPI